MTGKSVLDDLREGKPTVMMALARGSADREQALRLKELFGNPDLDPEGAAELRGIILDTGTLDRIEQMIRVRTEAALAALVDAPVSARGPGGVGGAGGRGDRPTALTVTFLQTEQKLVSVAPEGYRHIHL